jgi:hypothetical protein
MVGVPRETIPTAHYARGVYFSLSGRSPFSRLIYPLPEAGGLGCHLTLDLAGQARFGPDVEWIDSVDYRLDPARAAAFYHSIRRWWPQLPDGALQPAYAGVRPKLAGPGEPDADFVIQGPAQHGVAGLINLYGIESPGLTSCLALAAMVGAMANQTHEADMTDSPTLHSINLAAVSPMLIEGRRIMSGINKLPVSTLQRPEAIAVGKLGWRATSRPTPPYTAGWPRPFTPIRWSTTRSGSKPASSMVRAMPAAHCTTACWEKTSPSAACWNRMPTWAMCWNLPIAGCRLPSRASPASSFRRTWTCAWR